MLNSNLGSSFFDHFQTSELRTSYFADSIRCDNMEDGLYALDCSDKVAICSGGWKKIYGCPKGQFFIPALAKCDESWKCTETDSCGSGFVGIVYLGKVESIVSSISTVSVGKFQFVIKI